MCFPRIWIIVVQIVFCLLHLCLMCFWRPFCLLGCRGTCWTGSRESRLLPGDCFFTTKHLQEGTEDQPHMAMAFRLEANIDTEEPLSPPFGHSERLGWTVMLPVFQDSYLHSVEHSDDGAQERLSLVQSWGMTLHPVTRTLLGTKGITTRSKKLVVTSATLLVTGALLVVTRSYLIV